MAIGGTLFVLMLASMMMAGSAMRCASLARVPDTEDITAKRICDPKNDVKPNQLGWGCEEFKFYKVKGGARLKRDAVCE